MNTASLIPVDPSKGQPSWLSEDQKKMTTSISEQLPNFAHSITSIVARYASSRPHTGAFARLPDETILHMSLFSEPQEIRRLMKSCRGFRDQRIELYEGRNDLAGELVVKGRKNYLTTSPGNEALLRTIGPTIQSLGELGHINTFVLQKLIVCFPNLNEFNANFRDVTTVEALKPIAGQLTSFTTDPLASHEGVEAALPSLLQKMKVLQKLELSYMDLQPLLAVLPLLSHLTRLTLDHVQGLTRARMRALVAALPQLTYLKIHEDQDGPQEVSAKALLPLKDLVHLEELVLDVNGEHDGSFMPSVGAMKKLSKLTLEGFLLEDGHLALLEGLPLTSLALIGVFGEEIPEGLTRLMQSLPTLTHFKIQVASFCVLTALQHCPNLRSLTLEMVKGMDSEKAVELLMRLTHLEEIHFSSCEPITSLFHQALQAHPTLKKMSFTDTAILLHPPLQTHSPKSAIN